MSYPSHAENLHRFFFFLETILLFSTQLLFCRVRNQTAVCSEQCTLYCRINNFSGMPVLDWAGFRAVNAKLHAESWLPAWQKCAQTNLAHLNFLALYVFGSVPQRGRGGTHKDTSVRLGTLPLLWWPYARPGGLVLFQNSQNCFSLSEQKSLETILGAELVSHKGMRLEEILENTPG